MFKVRKSSVRKSFKLAKTTVLKSTTHNPLFLLSLRSISVAALLESTLVKAPVHVQGEEDFGRKEHCIDKVDSTLDTSTHTPSTTIVAPL